MNQVLRRKRKEQKLSQESVAKISGISTRSYQCIESGTRNPSVQTALAIAETLNSTVELLFGEGREMA